jgi:Xaa-Pro aminopeptidase
VTAALLALAIAAAPSPFPPDVYRARRARLMGELKGCAAVLQSRSTDDEVDPRFYWLTGIAEPGAAVLLAPREKTYRDGLYLAERNPELERYTGPREPIHPALRQKLGFDRVRRASRLGGHLFDALRHTSCLARLDTNEPPDGADEGPEAKLYGRVSRSFEGIATRQAWAPLEKMRMVKDDGELARVEKAVAASVLGHRAGLAALRPGATEHAVARAIDAAFLAAGADGPSYPSIVATGADAAVLHWEPREVTVGASDLALVDAAARVADYDADITRTWPVSGRFTPAQRKAYQAVLDAQEACFAALRPGVTFDELDRIAERSIVDSGYPDGMIHGVGHFVGLEVHDPGDYTAPLAAGTVLTIEPGIYLAGERLGVRIEDMVVLTKTGYRLLSAALPRRPEEVEAFVKSARAAPAP